MNVNRFIIILSCVIFITGCGTAGLSSSSGSIKSTADQSVLQTIQVGNDQVSNIPVADIEPTIALTFFGDMMLDRNVKKMIDVNGADYIFEKLFNESSSTLFASDIISANLEGPFANSRRPTTKSIAFRFDPKLITTLQKYKFNVFSQANNHSYDMGADAFNESKQNLKNVGLDFYGSQYQVNDDSLLIKDINGVKVAFLGFNDTNSAIDLTKAKALIIQARADADLVVVNVHWGYEYKPISNPNQRYLAHLFIDWGADIIIGHHPHVIQEMEVYKNRPIFYSLGNFVFDQYFSRETQEGLAVKINFGSDKVSLSVWPLQSVKSQAQLMGNLAANNYLKTWLKNCRLEGCDFIDNTLSLSLTP